jgi:hypothetical protein
MKFLAFFTYVVAVAAAFRSVHRTRGVVVTSRKVAGIQPPKTNDNDEKDGEFSINELMQNILSALPQVMDPSGWKNEMDPSRMIKNPPSYVRAQTLSGWKKSQSGSKHQSYHDMDVAEEFAKRWNVFLDKNTQKYTYAASQSNKLKGLLDELDELQLIEALDEYMAAKDNENFVAKGVAQSFSPMNSRLNPSYLKKEPKRLYKGVKLSQIHKKLKSDPSYFDH